MVSHVIGDYLVGQGLISKEQYANVLKEKRKIRASLSLIAVSEGILSYEEAQSIQAENHSDRAFAEAAIEMGYLSESQIRPLLRKQGSSYMAFAQALENQHLMNIEQLEHYLTDFQEINHLSYTDLEDLKSDDVNRVLPIYFPPEATSFINAAGVALRTLIRNVDSGIYPMKAYITDRMEADNGVIQFVEGEKEFSYAMVGKGRALTTVASRYMHEQFDEVDEDVLDVAGEIVNCISGLYATELSQDGVILDLQPPLYYENIKGVAAKGMLVLPLMILESQFYLLINMQNLVTII